MLHVGLEVVAVNIDGFSLIEQSRGWKAIELKILDKGYAFYNSLVTIDYLIGDRTMCQNVCVELFGMEEIYAHGS
jgi:hypothetical protein